MTRSRRPGARRRRALAGRRAVAARRGRRRRDARAARRPTADVGQLRMRARGAPSAAGCCGSSARWSPPRSSACARRSAPPRRPRRRSSRRCSPASSATARSCWRQARAVGLRELERGGSVLIVARPPAGARRTRAGARACARSPRAARAGGRPGRRWRCSRSATARRRRGHRAAAGGRRGVRAARRRDACCATSRPAWAASRFVDRAQPRPTAEAGRAGARRRRGAARRQRRRGRRGAPRARLRGDRRLPPAAARDEREPRRARSASTPRPSSRSSPTTSSTRPTWSRRVEAFLEADGNVAGTAQRLFTHRHTIRYRLERVRELCGLDVGSSDGREKLSLGLKAMRVLGIAGSGGPASERSRSADRTSGRCPPPPGAARSATAAPTGGQRRKQHEPAGTRPAQTSQASSPARTDPQPGDAWPARSQWALRSRRAEEPPQADPRSGGPRRYRRLGGGLEPRYSAPKADAAIRRPPGSPKCS